MNIFRSLVWLILIIITGLGATFAVADAVIRAHVGTKVPTFVHDRIGIGSHMLSGRISLQSSCDEVIVSTEKKSNSSYVILFSTWRVPHISVCTNTPVLRGFRTVIFAPSFGVSFTATLNGVPIDIVVIQ